ncbi:MAG: AraC family transcriptional regulator [Acutalibacteraceae bacterium]|nr:AraC family transcriptional regulator [Acutalibacteraceae bacterium]
MENYRFEDYSQIKEHIPCVVNYDIIRTKNKLSDTANWHHNLEIQLCCEGSGFVILDGVRTEIGVGDIVAVNCNTIHFTGTDDYIKYHCIIINNDFCENSGIDCSDIQFENVFKNPVIMNSIIQTVETYKNPDDVCYKAKLKYLILKILIEIRTYHTNSISVSKYDIKYFKEVKDTIVYIQNNYNKKITLEELAKETYIDKFSLSKKFKEFTGITVVTYINNYRSKQALLMIQKGEQIGDAARICGFNNISFFTKTFKKYSGNLPSFYKKKGSLRLQKEDQTDKKTDNK